MQNKHRVCGRPGCTRNIRSDNKKGVCADRKLCESPRTTPGPELSPVIRPKVLAEIIHESPPCEAFASDVERDFAVVTRRLGYDAAEIRAQLMAQWMEEIGELLREAEAA